MADPKQQQQLGRLIQIDRLAAPDPALQRQHNFRDRVNFQDLALPLPRLLDQGDHGLGVCLKRLALPLPCGEDQGDRGACLMLQRDRRVRIVRRVCRLPLKVRGVSVG